MRFLVFANGQMSEGKPEVGAWAAAADRIIAADGGTYYALKADLMPDQVIGDLDSLSETLQSCLKAQGVQFHRFPEAKDETDLELALLWAVEQPGVHEIVVLGAFGGRPDQALANLMLLALPALVGHQVVLIKQAWHVRLIRAGETLTLRGDTGDRVSLIPLGGPVTGVVTSGLVFGLTDEALAVGPARGLSNLLDAPTATVRVSAGLLWCFHENRSNGYHW